MQTFHFPDRYFDHASTTPLDPRVLDEMMPFLRGDFGNANSIHTHGQRAASAVELARNRIAQLIQAEDPSQIYFTSGATEANNWVLELHPDAVISPFEHSSLDERAVRQEFLRLENRGAEVVPCLKPASLISLMAVNNETGHQWSVAETIQPGQMSHCDATQAVGKLPFSAAELDFISLSAHKFYGPKGIGALYSRDIPAMPFIWGGEQEFGLRGGTLNVPGIVGLGVAAQMAMDEMPERMDNAVLCNNILRAGLQDVSGVLVNSPQDGSPYILNVSFCGVVGETLVIELDHRGFSVSSGAACSSRKTEPSHVLKALDVGPECIRGAVRFSFGAGNTPESASVLADSLVQIVEMLRTM